ncbi:hypothetical protein HK407_02g02530 [Ordospora pajunii]|uniref:uncharacterized protein n=1 Tax=Ordospora pajunii TaxID=3039483 RepID=UPI0029527E71|nr:uncharacterized protein HK407_02g02530 [Ordospora pajunii]KAH9412102.1 hypothetical protein HK407_02g02530 [Ordospora pajunii]
MNICKNKEFVNVVDDGVLLVMDIITLAIIHRKEYGAGAVIVCSEEHVFVGTGDGVLAMIDLLSMNETIVFKSNAPMTAVFYLDGFLYCGSEEGVIQVYGVAGESNVQRSSIPLSSMCSESDGMDSAHAMPLIHLVKEIKHSAPVRMICSDGVELFVADMRNKITVYPSKKVYDIVAPSLVYKNYVFASERSMLYCKTRNAFSTCLAMEERICEYVFSENGGVLFVRCGEEVSVVDFNSKEVVKKMRLGGMFVYDDDRNRILRYEAGVMKCIEGVLDKEYPSMNDVVFRADEIVEKKVRVDGMEDGAERVYSGNDEAKRPKRKRECMEAAEYAGYENLRVFFDESVEARRELSDLWMKTDSSEVYEGYGVKDCGSAQYQCLQGISTNEGLLLCYSIEGYMICVKNGSIHRIEVSYHDVTRRTIEVDDNNGCTHGGFCGDNVAVGNGSMVFYTGPGMKWEKKIASKAICVSDSMIVTLEDEIRIFDYTGKEIFNCLIPNAHMICCYGRTIAVFGNELFVIELFERTSRYMLPYAVSFACFDEIGRLFYVMNKKMYCLYKGLAVRMCDVSTDVLTVFKNNIVLLSKSKRLFPSPHVEYTALNVPLYIEHDEGTSIQQMNMNEVDNKENADHNAQHISAETTQNENLLNVSTKQDVNQVNSKRYNPFK